MAVMAEYGKSGEKISFGVSEEQPKT